MLITLLKYGAFGAGLSATLYLCLLGALTTQFFQGHIVYLHAIQMTWFKNLNVPEVFGFLHNQVTPFNIRSSDGQNLYAWHILPVDLYQKHEAKLASEESGLVPDIQSRHAFKLLRDDPNARLVIHMHGAGGTVGSGYRAPNYRALTAASSPSAPIHVLTFDYRGFGRSSGTPSEQGLISDAIDVVEWALNIAKIPPSRIAIFGQSLGTAVNIAVAEHYAKQSSPIVFAGHILIAAFVDVPTLVSTYSVAGTIPILAPLARFPALFDHLRSYIRDTWSTKDRIAEYVRLTEASGSKYRITIVHAEDDFDIPWEHTPVLFWHAVNATTPLGIESEALEQKKRESGIELGSGGTVAEWQSEHGVIREEILKHGLHDVIMGNPVVTLAVLRMFGVDGE